jgi:hypothetical protein
MALELGGAKRGGAWGGLERRLGRRSGGLDCIIMCKKSKIIRLPLDFDIPGTIKIKSIGKRIVVSNVDAACRQRRFARSYAFLNSWG